MYDDASKDVSPLIITELFEKKNEHQYNLRHNFKFSITAVNSLFHGSKIVSFLDHKIWTILLDIYI